MPDEDSPELFTDQVPCDGHAPLPAHDAQGPGRARRSGWARQDPDIPGQGRFALRSHAATADPRLMTVVAGAIGRHIGVD